LKTNQNSSKNAPKQHNILHNQN